MVAFNAGTKLSPAFSDDTAKDATVAHIREQTERGTSMAGEPETQVLPFWINLMAEWGSENHAYGADGILETEERCDGTTQQSGHLPPGCWQPVSPSFWRRPCGL